MIFIEINQEYSDSVNSEQLRMAAETTLLHQNARATIDLSIVIEDNERVQELNREFLGIDAPTDVLSFTANEIDPETGFLYLGDIIISFPMAQSQAAQAGHPVMAELQLLVVHGTLHLLGHDHSEESEKLIMWEDQREILDSMHCPLAKYPD